ncbi:TPA: FAD-dependent thymidylate synthase [Candidatus Berkelbacteria bacterium]|uniref:Thymidylate synthase complementing protein ThyX family protein n=1 Tax=Berkelbacteria bacterium GW2011_GWE1_39_12 TaxID=1618337 RepID=A0A0G4B573_9BACT|nr:MAG: thymidylate synthase complementing protein ThyX family protein [Berkelbacteria bacterium GW2011_GWE1_39_12]HBO60348.1 FAD-dependent thymidylate synthase [Candidatus Berkelbacteria bacterium]
MKYGAKRRVYPLVGYNPEIVSVTFGKCSRSPEPFDQIIQELDADKSRKFHEKWIIGYGHKSVAEHAVLSMAFENISILATKFLEDNRLASYTEKSTRYQKFDRNRYYKPKVLMENDLGKLYEQAVDFYFESYNEIVKKMYTFIENKYPQEKGMDDKLYASRTRNKVFDSCRYLLPIATQTNMGMTVNARQLDYAVTKMLSQPLGELQEIAEEIRKATIKTIPTLIKFAAKDDFIVDTTQDLSLLSHKILGKIDPKKAESTTLVKYDEDAEEKVLTSLIYKYSSLPYSQIRSQVKKMSNKEKEKIIDTAVSKIQRKDQAPREFEHTFYTFDILMDYGAFRDIQRHRMATQTNQLATTEHGYSTPEEIVEAGLKNEYEEVMERADKTYKKIAKKFPMEAQYCVPLGYKKRTLITMNLREVYHFVKLRTGPAGHISYRRIAQEVYKKVKEVHPLLAKNIIVNLD